MDDSFSKHHFAATLQDLIDIPSVRELLEHIGRIHHLETFLFNPAYKIVVDTATSQSDFSAWLEKEGMAEKWQQFKQEMMDPLPKRGSTRDCVFENKVIFRVIPIINELDVIGAAAIGPLFEDKKHEADEFYRIVGFVQSILDVLVFSSYKRYLTNLTHIESITESYRQLEQANRELQVSYEQLKEIDQLKSNFLAVVSHELRTPLTSVIGYSEMLLEGIGGDLSDTQRNYVHVIMEKGDQLLSLIREILNLTKIEAGQMKVVLQSAVPGEILRTAVDSIRPSAAKKDLEVQLILNKDIPEKAMLDRDKMIQILNNLLSNAVKFTENGVICVEMGCAHYRHFSTAQKSEALSEKGKKKYLFVRVEDSGIGIPDDQLEKVFQKFYQVDDSSTRAFGGTGLGLAIAKSFVEMHGGEIWVESVLGKGTTISFTVPL